MHYFLIKKLADEKIATNSHAKYSQSQVYLGGKNDFFEKKILRFG